MVDLRTPRRRTVGYTFASGIRSDRGVPFRAAGPLLPNARVSIATSQGAETCHRVPIQRRSRLRSRSVSPASVLVREPRLRSSQSLADGGQNLSCRCVGMCEFGEAPAAMPLDAESDGGGIFDPKGLDELLHAARRAA